jgi:hypothetical protein
VGTRPDAELVQNRKALIASTQILLHVQQYLSTLANGEEAAKTQKCPERRIPLAVSRPAFSNPRSIDDSTLRVYRDLTPGISRGAKRRRLYVRSAAAYSQRRTEAL